MKNSFKITLFSFVSILTLSLASSAAANYVSGDFDHNYKVDIHDMQTFAEQWLDPTGTCSGDNCADLDSANGVNMADWAILANNWQGGSARINEFMASNATIIDSNIGPDITSPDWIEIHNPNSEDVNLAGWYLTDSAGNLDKWPLPNVTMGPDEYLLVFASNQDANDYVDPNGYYHTNFNLDEKGEYLALVDPNGIVVQEFNDYEYNAGKFGFPPQRTDVSYGIYNGQKRYFEPATPESQNGPGYLGIVADTKFSHDRGFYDAPCDVIITCETAGATIYYTIDGSEPTESDTEYTSSISISTTTTLRAKAFKAGWLATNCDTQSYLMNMNAGIKSLPAISIVGDEGESLYEPNGVMAIVGGVYVGGKWTNGGNPAAYNNPMQRGKAFEKPVSVELIQPADNSGFQVDCGLRVGGSNHHRPRYRRSSNWISPFDGGNNYKFSLKLYFRNEYEDSRLEYPLFPDSSISRFRSLCLRGGHGESAQLVRDRISRRLHQNIGEVASSGIVVNLFINGSYKGFFELCERLDEEYYQEVYDSGDYDKWDVISADSGIRDGNDTRWLAVTDYMRTHDLSIPENYREAARLFDIEAFIDYLIMEIYVSNVDWVITNYVVAGEHSQQPYNSQFRYYAWDAELALGWGSSTTQDAFEDYPPWGGPYSPGLNHIDGEMGWQYRTLKANEDFKQLFADQIQKHFFNDGAFTQANITNCYYEVTDDFLTLLNLYTGGLSSNTTKILNTFIPARRAITLQAFADNDLFNLNLDAPEFNVNGSPQHGGYASAGDSLTIDNPNPSSTIYYGLDGNDPREPGGAVAPTASIYSTPISLLQSTLIKARVLDTGTWSALTEAVYAIGPVAENLRITEIMYHPKYTGDANDPNTEFIELMNIGVGSANDINLNLVQFTNGIHFTFPNTALAAGDYVVLVADANAFAAKYPSFSGVIAGTYTGRLENAGERIRLADAAGTEIHNFRYKDGWHEITDGDDFSLTLIDPNNPDPNSWGEKQSWDASTFSGGSPGEGDDGMLPYYAVVINEALAHSDGFPNDWIELYNATIGDINIGGWYLSDSDKNDANLMKYRIADGTIIGAGAYMVFTQDENFGGAADSDPGRLDSFGLSKNGDMICLTSAQAGVLTGYRKVEDFGASENGVAFGRYYNAGTDSYNFVAMNSNTSGSLNDSPKVWDVVINEIMYNPPAGGSYDNDEYEYIEIYNRSGSTVDLFDSSGNPWKFNNGIQYLFPPATTLGAGEYLVVVKNPTAFSSRYPSVPGSKIFGPYDSGKLDNGGEKLDLSIPGDEVDGERKYIRIDRVDYDDEALWPTEPDGSNGDGSALGRKVTSDYGNDVANWQAIAPSPGGP